MKDFHIRLNPETVEQIKQAADKDSRTVSAMARKILEDYFKPAKGVYWCGVPINDLKGQDLEDYKNWYQENYMPNKYEEGKGGILYGLVPFLKYSFDGQPSEPLKKLKDLFSKVESNKIKPL